MKEVKNEKWKMKSDPDLSGEKWKFYEVYNVYEVYKVYMVYKVYEVYTDHCSLITDNCLTDNWKKIFISNGIESENLETKR